MKVKCTICSRKIKLETLLEELMETNLSVPVMHICDKCVKKHGKLRTTEMAMEIFENKRNFSRN